MIILLNEGIVANEAGGMEIDTTVDGVETTSVEDGHHLQDATTTAQDRTHTAGTGAITMVGVMMPTTESDRDRLTATDDRTHTGREAPARTDVAVRSLPVISSTFLGATATTSLMYRFL